MAQVWARCRPYIEDALAHSGATHVIEDVEAGIERGELHFWGGRRCAVVTEWLIYPRAKRLNIWLMGGDLRELLGPMLHAVEAWAKENGATELVGGAVNRTGWERALAASGFAPRWIMLSKELH